MALLNLLGVAKVYQSQRQALRQVNRSLISLYWEIGKSIVEKQEKHGWGKSVVANLSKDLQNEFPGVNGFSVQNLWYMRKFYRQYRAQAKIQQAAGEISWTHNMVIIDKCKSLEESLFYSEMARKYGWTRNVLIHHIEGKSYQQYLLGQTTERTKGSLAVNRAQRRLCPRYPRKGPTVLEPTKDTGAALVSKQLRRRARY